VAPPEKALEALEKDGIDFIQIPGNVLDRRFEKACVFESAKEKIGGSLFKDGENHELLKQVGNFGGLSKSATSGFYSVSFRSSDKLITRYVSRGNMVAQVEAAGLIEPINGEDKIVDGQIVMGTKGNKIDWAKLNWQVTDGELLLIS